jgi:DHA1 family quinolone resistance protein-like MFS transporter
MNRVANRSLMAYLFLQICKSTALTTPVLYLLLQNDLGLSLSRILAVYAGFALLGIALELPTGILCDLWSPKKTICLALAMQSASFVSLMILPPGVVLNVFLLLSVISASLFSGSDQSLLRQMLVNDEMKEYRTVAFAINGKMYLYTSPLLVAGVLLYRTDYRILLSIQALSTIAAFLALANISVPTSSVSSRPDVFVKRFKDLISGLRMLLNNRKFLGLALLSGAFSSAVLVNHKIIQSQVEAEFPSDPLIWIAFLFSIGNVVSWAASTMASRYLRINPNVIGFIIFLTLSLTAILLTLLFSAKILIFLGYFGICAFKSVYRPFVSSQTVQMVWSKSNTASSVSALVFIGSMVSALVHFAASRADESLANKNLAAMLAILVVCCFGLVLFCFTRTVRLHESMSKLTGKRNTVVLKKEVPTFIQTYPIGELAIVEKISRMSAWFPYTSPILYATNLKLRTMEWEAIKGSSLANDPSPDLDALQTLFSKPCKNSDMPEICFELATGIPSPSELFEAQPDLVDLFCDEKYLRIIHGDLHPGNILKSSNGMTIVDWDNAGVGFLWFDVFSLFCHPDLKCEFSGRVSALVRLFPELSNPDLFLASEIFCHFKSRQLSRFGSKDSSLLLTSKEFAIMSEQFRNVRLNRLGA